MKKLLVLLFLLILILAGCASNLNPSSNGKDAPIDDAGPPPTVTLRGLEDLEEIREMATADDETLEEYLWTRDGGGMKTREDVVAFLELMDSLPIPLIPDAEWGGLSYAPEYQDIYMTYETQTGEIYAFRFFLEHDSVEETIEEKTGVMGSPIYQRENGRIKVFNHAQTDPPASEVAVFWIDIDGYFVRAGYRKNDQDVSGVAPEEIYSELTLTSLSGNTQSTYTTIRLYDEKAIINGDWYFLYQPTRLCPVIRNNRTMLPMRFVCEQGLGCTIDSWDEETLTATVSGYGITVVITIGEEYMLVDNVPVELDAPAELIEGSTFLPLRALGEAFGFGIGWDAVTGTIVVAPEEVSNEILAERITEIETIVGPAPFILLDGKIVADLTSLNVFVGSNILPDCARMAGGSAYVRFWDAVNTLGATVDTSTGNVNVILNGQTLTLDANNSFIEDSVRYLKAAAIDTAFTDVHYTVDGNVGILYVGSLTSGQIDMIVFIAQKALG